jgi:hypothetical protein
VNRKEIRYVAASLHALTPDSAGSFVNAIRGGAFVPMKKTVVASAFVRTEDFAAVAKRFAPEGPYADQVATLLVYSKTASEEKS